MPCVNHVADRCGSPARHRPMKQAMRVALTLVALAVAAAQAAPAAAATYYVSPSGLPSNDGSIGRPLDLATALSSQGPVRPGDTVWLRGGIYRRPAPPEANGDNFIWSSTISGTAAAPIVVRQYPGERATLDGGLTPTAPVLVINGSYTWFWGFEVTNSDPNRSTARGDGVDTFGHHNRLINLVIHDVGNGIGFWATNQADDSEIHGSLISHNGWEASDRGHGHSIYVQNTAGTKKIVNNILFESYSFGVHAYTSNSRLDNITIAGNIAFNHGVPSPGAGAKANILFAGGQIAQNPVVSGNYSYYPVASGGRALDITGCNNGRLQDNYLAATMPLRLASCAATTITGNILAGPIDAGQAATYPSNTFTATPSGVQVGIRPNAYEAGRANVVVYNWGLAPSVTTPLTGAGIAVGDTIEIRDAQNYFGAPVFSGVYNGQVVLPMTGLSATPISGNAPYQPGHTSAQFGAFVVQRITGGGGGPVTPPSASLTASPASITAGAPSTLTWSTSGAASVSIAPTVGTVGPSGTAVVTPGATTTYTLTATNTGGTTTSTAVVTVQAAANVPPVVTLTAPGPGSTFTQGAAVTLQATANDPDGSVVRVDFLVDGAVIGSDTSAPYAGTWTAGTVGTHTIRALAVDNRGASTNSGTVSVSVSAPAGGGRTNVALASAGATATASSSYSADFGPRAAIDGRRSGAIRGQLGTWEDANGGAPDWLQVTFGAQATIDTVNVFSIQERHTAPVEPTVTLRSYLAAEDFQVQYWNGSAWVTPTGGQVTGNQLVWRSVTFAPVTTTAIRVYVTKVAGGYTRLTEVEALTSGGAPPPPPPNVPPTVTLTAPAAASVLTQGAAVTLQATAGDADGTVARVDFAVDGQLVGSDATAPYSLTWTASTPGAHSLMAIATDNQNASTTSVQVNVTVTTVTPAPGGTNVALAASGATATASSTYSADYGPRAAIDGRRSGAVRGQMGTWEDANGAAPDWLQVTFAAPSTIHRVNVFSMQERHTAPVEPTATLTSYLAAEDFQVQYWNGSAWTPVPGGQITGNRLVWRQVDFAAVTTTAIRIHITKVAGGFSRLTEVEAWTQ